MAAKTTKKATKTTKRPSKKTSKPGATRTAAREVAKKAQAAGPTARLSTKPTPAGRLAEGSRAPAFALKDQSGRDVRLKDFAGRKLLVYFYPAADTPGCTVQSCSVRDHREGLRRLGVDVVGISPDVPEDQAKFDRKFRLGFPLLADTRHATAEAWGAWGEKNFYGKKSMGVIRSSFLVGEDGRILRAWYKVKPDETVPKAEEALRTA